jgi:hypothetical protein
VSVYVDNGRARHTSRWCHMTADSREELDAMAVKIGLRVAWRQASGTWREHYDLTEPKRRAAVAAGAIEVDWREQALARVAARRAERDAEPDGPRRVCTCAFRRSQQGHASGCDLAEPGGSDRG